MNEFFKKIKEIIDAVKYIVQYDPDIIWSALISVGLILILMILLISSIFKKKKHSTLGEGKPLDYTDYELTNLKDKIESFVDEKIGEVLNIEETENYIKYKCKVSFETFYYSAKNILGFYDYRDLEYGIEKYTSYGSITNDRGILFTISYALDHAIDNRFSSKLYNVSHYLDYNDYRLKSKPDERFIKWDEHYGEDEIFSHDSYILFNTYIYRNK